MFNIKQRANLIDSIKNEKLKEQFIDINGYIKKFVDKETRDYCDHVKKISSYKCSELDNPLLHRRFFFKAIKEINNELSEDNAGFLVDITSDLRALFNQQTIVYHRKYWYYDLKKEVICLQLLGMDLYKLKSLVKDN